MLRQSQHERKLINNSKRPPVAPVTQPARLRQLRLSSRPVLNWEKGVKPFDDRGAAGSKVQAFCFSIGTELYRCLARNYLNASLTLRTMLKSNTCSGSTGYAGLTRTDASAIICR